MLYYCFIFVLANSFIFYHFISNYWINLYTFRLEAINKMFKILILTVLLSVNFVFASRILPSFIPNGNLN
jgi:hypothetical protein